MSNFLTDPVAIVEWCHHHQITKFDVTAEGKIDVFQDVYISHVLRDVLPVQFGSILGNFTLELNALTSLIGCPTYIRGPFYESHTDITTLKHSPRHVGGILMCNDNRLTSLEGISEYIGGDIYCTEKNLDDQDNLNYDIIYQYDVSDRDITLNKDIFSKYQNYAKSRRRQEIIADILSPIDTTEL